MEREVALADWGKALLEEVLVRAAERLAASGAGADRVDVSLEFQLTPSADGLEIRTPGALEPPLLTRLARPF